MDHRERPANAYGQWPWGTVQPTEQVSQANEDLIVVTNAGVRKLDITHPRENMPLILALSHEHDDQQGGDIDNFYSEGVQARLSTFMSNLEFWQDILEHCRSLEIKQTLIDHFQVFFLQQIL